MKILFWMNMPSHHQTAFFDAVQNHEEIDLEVRYYDTVSADRKKLGWSENLNLPKNQRYIDSTNLKLAFESVTDWKERIHIVPGFSNPFLKQVLTVLISKNIKWIHWSERSGKPLTRLLNYNYNLINFLMPLYYTLKGYRRHAKKINKHALGAFAISELAKKDFKKWGIKEKKIKILNYSLQALNSSKSNPLLRLIEEKYKIFMYVGVLTPHKGIDILIKAFSKLLYKDDWKLVLIGNDVSKGLYEDLIQELNLEKQIYLLGTVKTEMINDYIDNSHVFILPTLFDGWGAVLNEAASLNKPLISTNQCGAAFHLIENGVNGFRIEAKSVDALNKAMQYYIDHENMIEQHGRQSKILFDNNLPRKNSELLKRHIFEFIRNV